MRRPATLDRALRPALLGLVGDEVTRYTLDRLVAELADTEHALAAVSAEVREMGLMVAHSEPEADLRWLFWQRWGVGHTRARRPGANE